MKIPRPRINTVLIVLFLIMWLYTEVAEYNERHAIYMDFKSFHDKGKRFTAAEGDVLEARIEILEVELEDIQNEAILEE